MSIALATVSFPSSVGAQRTTFRSYGARKETRAGAINISPLRGEE